jgi:glycosyltransferase involved in cell wall biosynthesis
MPPRVSIVISVRNEGKFLKECLKSILQHILSHWELIAVGDHSTNESYQILEKFVQRDGRLRIFKNPGNVISDCLNFAIYIAKSPLIARMDGDDLIEPKPLEIHVDQLDKNKKVGLVVSQVEPFLKAIKNQRKGY